jgi:RNA polymerase sigma-70 factor (ECF subfamily)
MAEPMDQDAALMLRVKGGDREAFTTLVDKYKQPVMNLVYYMVQDPDEAEDLAQQVFLQVYRSAHRYQITARFSTWLFTIARNLSLNELRRRRRRPTEPLEQPYPEREDSPPRQLPDPRSFPPPEALLQEELRQKIEKALADLPEKQRTAILLCRQEDVSYEEIARILGCSLSATKSLIHRGRETLKRRLKPYLQSGVWKEG